MRKYLSILLLSLVTSAYGQVTDSFAGTGALSGNWSQASVTTPPAAVTTACVRLSGSAVPTTPGTQCMAGYTGTTFPDDQQVSAMVTGGIGGNISLHWHTNGDQIAYLPEIGRIYVLLAGAGDHSVASGCSVPSVGDIISFKSIGNLYIAYINNVEACRGTDSTAATSSGVPAIYVDQATNAGSGFSNFAAGPYTSLSLSPLAVSVGTTGNVVALTGVGTTWGSSCPVFTLTGGTGASITAHSCSSDTVASITVTAGSTDANLVITDPSTTDSTILIAHSPISYFQRDGGGTRYSINQTSGQCNGKFDVDYPGTGVNQDCAFQYIRMFWADGSFTDGHSFPGWGWILLPGDTAWIETAPGTDQESRVGWSGPNGTDFQYGIAGDFGASGSPPIPSGTVANPTRVLGKNWGGGTCMTKTQIHGGYGVGNVLATNGSQNVVIGCLDITDHAQCGKGASAIGFGCSTSFPLPDFANEGITSSNTNLNVLIQDVSIHGMASHGMLGTHGDNFQFLNGYIGYNSVAGWDHDDGSHTGDVGTSLIQDSEIEASGCLEVYPNPGAYLHPGTGCTDQSHGGYGDAIGTATSIIGTPPTSHEIVNRSKVHNNTQDGPDFLHGAGAGSSVTVSNSFLYANMGQQAKLGAVAPTFFNNAINGNNTEMCTPGGLPGWPPDQPIGSPQSLGDCGRGGNIDVLIDPSDTYTSIVAYNSINSDSGYAFYFKCGTGSCTGPVVQFQNNAFQGNFSAPISSNTYSVNADEMPQGLGIFSNPGSLFQYNVKAGDHYACPIPTIESHYICGAPGYTDPSWQAIGIGNYYPATSGSNIVNFGTPLPAVTTIDITGHTRSASTPTAGAYEFITNRSTVNNRSVIKRGTIQ